MTPGVMRRVVGRFLCAAISQMVFAICVSFSLAVSVPVSTHPYDTAAPMYDGAAHSVQAHTSEPAPVVSREGSQGLQGSLVIATGPLSVVRHLSVAADTGIDAAVGGGPKTSPYFKPPTNAPQLPPTEIPAGWRVRVQPPTADYANGYWKLEKPMGDDHWQPIDPSTMKPGTHPETHVPFPGGG